ncbi:MAG: alpha/beta fold hydrolase [Brevundimonas sp.]|nr:MAG: alpha/beta fold hydrolase [Brevundimonas sp.]
MRHFLLACMAALLSATPALAQQELPAHRQVPLMATAPAGHVIAGEVLLPDGATSSPVVLLISGTGRQSRDFAGFDGRYRPHRDLAQALLARGIGVIRFDERNTGESTGDHRTASGRDLREDAWLAFEQARAVPGVDPAHMFIFGGSEGAVFAMQLAAEKEGVAGIAIAGAPFRSGRDMSWDQIQAENPRKEGESEEDHRARVEKAYDEDIAFQKSRPSLADMLDYNGGLTAAAVHRPVLIIEGAEDWQVRAPAGFLLETTMRSSGNAEVQRAVFPGVGHLLTPNPVGVVDYDQLQDFRLDPRVTTRLADWILQVSASSPTGTH